LIFKPGKSHGDRHFKKEQEDLAEIIVAKHRNGPIGTIQLKFDAEFIKFSNSNC
jgi:replicative DNA helicase